jgi:photosystem II stability/assembly factor-like uncharacterized protein
VFGFDAQGCVVADQMGRFWRTTDGGLNWTQVYEGTGRSINGIHFSDEQNGWAVGDPVDGRFVILETTNGGMTWIPNMNAPPASPTMIGYARSWDWIGTSIGVFGTNEFVIWRTTDGGAQWDSVRTNMLDIPGLALNNDGIGLAGGSIGSPAEERLDRSTDLGQSWHAIENPSTQRLKTLDFIDGTSEVWGVTTQSGLYQSTNAGLDWVQYILGPPSGLATEDVDFVDSSTGWCVGWGNSVGRIFKYSSTVDVKSAGATPAGFIVFAAPNPFDREVDLAFGRIEGDRTEISIYDVAGRRVRSLAGGPGTPMGRIHWDGRDLSGAYVSGGKYFYRVRNGNGEASGSLIKLR